MRAELQSVLPASLAFTSLKPRKSTAATVTALFCGALSSVALYGATHSVPGLLAVVLIYGSLFLWQIGTKNSIGIFLALIPLQWLLIACTQFYGVHSYRAVSATKELILLLSIFWCIFNSPRIALRVSDVLLLLALFTVMFEQMFALDLQGARTDWEWILPYLLGRFMPVNTTEHKRWAVWAVWICAALSVLGAWEVFSLGSFPRLLLINANEGIRELPSCFHASGYAYLRAASTMSSPLAFGAICMVGLLLWWTYMSNPLPALLCGAGLMLTMTRSAIIATVVGFAVLSYKRREGRKFAALCALVLAFCALSYYALDLQTYVAKSLATTDEVSLQGHEQSLATGWETLLQNPFGTGAGTVGPRVVEKSSTALDIESSYLTIGVEYGILTGVLFAAFILACLWRLSRSRTSTGIAAFAILIGFSLQLAVGPILQDVPLSCWIWFPVGLGMSEAGQPGRDWADQTEWA